MASSRSSLHVVHLLPHGTQPHPTLAGILDSQNASVVQKHFEPGKALPKFSEKSAQVDVFLVQCDRSVTLPPPAKELAGSSSGGASVTSASFLQLLHSLSSSHPTAFICVCTVDPPSATGSELSRPESVGAAFAPSSAAASGAATAPAPTAGSGTDDPLFRWACFAQSVHMVTALIAAPRDLTEALRQVAAIKAQREAAAVDKAQHVPVYTCCWCPQDGLPEDALHAHLPLFHAHTVQPHAQPCPICSKQCTRLGVHLFNDHGPQGRGELASETRTRPNVLYPYALVVARRPRDGRFLVVQEFASSGYWLPGGRAENGEPLSEAAVRETIEEAGVRVKIKGVLRMEYHSNAARDDALRENASYARLRVLFYAEPVEGDEEDEDSPSDACKTLPNYESVGAAWISLEELKHVRLRGSEPQKWFPYVAEGGTIFPLQVLKE